MDRSEPNELDDDELILLVMKGRCVVSLRFENENGPLSMGDGGSKTRGSNLGSSWNGASVDPPIS